MKKTLVTFCLIASGFIAFAIEPEKDSSGNLTFTVASGAETYSGIIEGSGITVTKKGTGSLTLTGANTFSGELIVEEGILTASPTAHKGKPALVVKNGATFVSDGGGEAWEPLDLTSIAIEGSGVDGQGAFVRKSGTAIRIATPVTLTGDATVNFIINHNPGAVSLNGYTLTKKGKGTWDAYNSGVVSANIDSANSSGKIIIAEGALQIQQMAFRKGSDKNLLVFKPGTAFNMYTFSAKCPWSVKVEGDVTFNAKNEHATNTARIGGNVEIIGGVLTFNHSKPNSVWCFDGSVTATDGASLKFVDGITRFYGDVDLGTGGYTVAKSDDKTPLPDARVEFYGNFNSASTDAQKFLPQKGLTRFSNADEVSILAPIGYEWDKYNSNGGATGRLDVVNVKWFYHPNTTYLSGSYDIPQMLYITNSVWSGTSKIIVGNNFSVGRLEMYDSIVTNGMTIGGMNTAGYGGCTGGVLQYGGSMVIADGSSVYIGGGMGRSYGYYEKHGGELILDDVFLGYYGYGAMYLSGGTSKISKITLSGKYNADKDSSGSSVFYSNGGAKIEIPQLAIFRDGYATNCESLMVLEGAGTTLKSDTCVHYAIQPSIANLAVNDGAEFNPGQSKRYSSEHDRAEWRFSVDGGILTCCWHGEYWGSGSTLLDSVTVHSGGLSLNTMSEAGTFVWKIPFSSPTGKIVSSITLPTDQTFEAEQGRYIAPPRVKITGAGFGAAAIALYDWKTRRVTGIKVVAPGSGYDENTKAYILTKSNGEWSPFECPVTLIDAPTTGMGFTKKGPGSYSFDVANTYHGPTTVEAGKLIVNKAEGIPLGSSLCVQSGATLDLKNNNITTPELSGEGTIVVGGSLKVTDSVLLPVKTAGKIVVNGPLTLGEGAKVILDGDAETLDREVGTVLLSATSLVLDKSLVLPTLPEPWHISVGEKNITIRRMVGTVVILR